MKSLVASVLSVIVIFGVAAGLIALLGGSGPEDLLPDNPDVIVEEIDNFYMVTLRKESDLPQAKLRQYLVESLSGFPHAGGARHPPGEESLPLPKPVDRK